MRRAGGYFNLPVRVTDRRVTVVLTFHVKREHCRARRSGEKGAVMPNIIKATADQAGCWIEDSWGHYDGIRAVMIAWDRGMPHDQDDEKIVNAYRAGVFEVLADGTEVKGQEDAGGYLNEQGGMVDKAVEWLTENVAPAGFHFEWDDGLQMLECSHTWVAGVMDVHREDLVAIVEMRDVECDNCDVVIRQGTEVPERYIYPGE
jgi:hypothetical protein